MKKLKDTIQDMTSDNYKDRFKAEYDQLKIRYVKLASLITHIEAAKEVNLDYDMISSGIIFEEPKHDCPLSLLKRQLRNMDDYLKTLGLRAAIENIPLSDE